MTKTWDTKNKILKMLSEKRMTLTQISLALGLAPSTVNQHIKELLSINAIRQVNNPYILKWKYYELNPSFNKKPAEMEMKVPVKNPIVKAVPFIVIIGVIAGFLFLFGGKLGLTSAAVTAVPAGSALFSISDSPTVAAVSSVNITIDSMQVRNLETGKWYTVLSTPETFNLVSLDNISQLIGTANLSAGEYDEITIQVQNVTTVINNQTEPVILPTHTLTLIGKFNVTSNGTSSWVNIDVNLDKSLHITQNGEVVMLPVIVLRSENGANLSMTSKGILSIKSPGKLYQLESEGMDANGVMEPGSQVPVASQVNITSSGGVAIVSASPANSTVVIRTPDKIIIIVNVNSSTALNITGESNNSTSVRVISVGPLGGQAGLPPTNGTLICNSSNCWSNVNMSINTSFPLRLWHTCMCPFQTVGCRCYGTNSTVIGNFSISNATPPQMPMVPCQFCPGTLVNSSGNYSCTPREESGQAWPSFKCGLGAPVPTPDQGFPNQGIQTVISDNSHARSGIGGFGPGQQ